MSQNSHGESQEKILHKRQRDLEDESKEVEKFSKIKESKPLEAGMERINNNTEVVDLNEDFSVSDSNLNLVKSNVYVSRNRYLYADVIWKVEVGKNAMKNLSIIETSKKNNQDLFFAWKNIFHSGSNSSTLIFCFQNLQNSQNGQGLSKEDFMADINTIGSFLDNEEKKKENLNFSNNKTQNLLIKESESSRKVLAAGQDKYPKQSKSDLRNATLNKYTNNTKTENQSNMNIDEIENPKSNLNIQQNEKGENKYYSVPNSIANSDPINQENQDNEENETASKNLNTGKPSSIHNVSILKTGISNNRSSIKNNSHNEENYNLITQNTNNQITLETIRNLESVRANQGNKTENNHTYNNNNHNNDTVSVSASVHSKSMIGEVVSNSAVELSSEIDSDLVSSRSGSKSRSSQENIDNIENMSDSSQKLSLESSNSSKVSVSAANLNSQGKSQDSTNNKFCNSQSQTNNTGNLLQNSASILSRIDKRELKGKYHINENNPKNNSNYSNSNSTYTYNPSYDINIHINIIDYRIFSFSYKDVQAGEIILEEIPLNSAFYSKVLANSGEVKLVVEFSMKKDYNRNTGYTGIINEAMTCYMNSMLQTLNVLGYFKKAVFQIPTWDSEESSMAVAYSLQRLFFDLKHEDKAISTNRLTQSFGWSRDQIFIQHDVQEFNLMLSDVMEKNMKGTPVEGTFTHLFNGKILNYIQCLDVDYKSNKEEAFCDLQLTVKGCRNLIESFEKYTEEEILDGEDRYQTDNFGKQRAKKGLKFLNFPNVLILQLKRFEYNPRRDTMDKINDYFEFFDEIDLNKFIYQGNEKDENLDNVFCLHSVVVHKGGINCGHYFAFIRPDCDDKWIMFNDEIVREADWDEVFTNNFGGSSEIWKHRDKGLITKINSKPDGNAYILVYIRKSKRETILCNVENKDIPDSLRDMINKDKAKEKKQEILNRRMRDNIDISIITKDNILKHRGLGISPSATDLDLDHNLDSYTSTSFNIPKSLSIKDFIKFIHEKSGIPVEFIDLYCYILTDPNRVRRRFNFRLKKVPHDYIENKEIFDLKDFYIPYKFGSKNIFLYIEIKASSSLDVKGVSGCESNAIRDSEAFPLDPLETIDPLDVFEYNPDYNDDDSDDEEEYVCCDNKDREIIYIPQNNKYKIKKFSADQIESNFKLKPKVDKLIIFKYLTSSTENTHNSEKLSLIVDEIAQIEYPGKSKLNIETNPNFNLDNNHLNTGISISQDKGFDLRTFRNYKEKYKTYLNDEVDLDDMEVCFLLEKTSADYEVTKSMEVDVETKVNTGINQSIIEVNNLMITENVSEITEHDSSWIAGIEDLDDVLTQNDEADSIIIIVSMKKNTTSATSTTNSNSMKALQYVKEMDSFTSNSLSSRVFSELPSIKSVIVKLADYLHSRVFVPIFYLTADRIFIPIEEETKKYEMFLNEAEDEVRQRLLHFLKSIPKSFERMMKDKYPVFYLTTQRKLISQTKFIEDLNESYLTLIDSDYSKIKPNIVEINSYPLTQFIGVERKANHLLKFYICPYPEDPEDPDDPEDHDDLSSGDILEEKESSTKIDFYGLNLSLFDINNNPMNKVFICLPNGIVSCESVISYIYDPVLSFFYDEPSNSGENHYFNQNKFTSTRNQCKFDPDDFYFIIQHRQSTFAYEIFNQRDMTLTQYERQQDLCLQYRIQPFSREEIENFKHKSKVFIALATKEGNSACDPFILHISRDETVRDVKNLVLNKMSKIKALDEKYGEINISKVKFYTYSLINYRPNKDILLLSSKDEEPLFNYFKSKHGAPNLLVEFLIGEKQPLNNGPSHTFIASNETLCFDSFTRK